MTRRTGRIVGIVPQGKARAVVHLEGGTRFSISEDEIRNRDLRVTDVIKYDEDRIADSVMVVLPLRPREAVCYACGQA